MLHIKESIIINQPVRAIYTLLTSPKAIPTWRKDVLEVTPALDTIQVADQFDELVNFMGHNTYRMKVVELVPNERIVIQAINGPGVLPTQTFYLKQGIDGVIVTFQGDLETKGVFRLVAPFLTRPLSKKWEGYLAKLKEIIEQ